MRNLAAVIDQMLKKIPETEEKFRNQLIDNKSSFNTAAPELQYLWWEGVHSTIINNLPSVFDKDWQFEILSIFTTKSIEELKSIMIKPDNLIVKKKDSMPIYTVKLHKIGEYFPNVSKDQIQRGLDAPIIKELIKHKSWLGSPKYIYNNISNFLVIDLIHASHRILKYWWENDILYGEIETLDTEDGRFLKGLLEFDINFVIFKIRALKNENELKIITFDFDH